jgi:hypothetical protein
MSLSNQYGGVFLALRRHWNTEREWRQCCLHRTSRTVGCLSCDRPLMAECRLVEAPPSLPCLFNLARGFDAAKRPLQSRCRGHPFHQMCLLHLASSIGLDRSAAVFAG